MPRQPGRLPRIPNRTDPVREALPDSRARDLDDPNHTVTLVTLLGVRGKLLPTAEPGVAHSARRYKFVAESALRNHRNLACNSSRSEPKHSSPPFLRLLTTFAKRVGRRSGHRSVWLGAVRRFAAECRNGWPTLPAAMRTKVRPPNSRSTRNSAPGSPERLIRPLRSSVPGHCHRVPEQQIRRRSAVDVMQNDPKAQLANDLDRALQSTGANRRRSGGYPQ
jgi:hypothetical protein